MPYDVASRLLTIHYIVMPVWLLALSVGAYAGAVAVSRLSDGAVGSIRVAVQAVVLFLGVVAINCALGAAYFALVYSLNPAVWAAVFVDGAGESLRQRGYLP